MEEFTLQQEIERVKQLREAYQLSITNPNSRNSIESYHLWYDASNVLFSRYFSVLDTSYNNFSSVDNFGNGYSLYHNYQQIRKDFCVMIDALERGEESTTCIIPNKESDKLLISRKKKRVFISHASKDRTIIDHFVDSVLLLGMELDSESIAYTSREETGVEPGKSIPQFIQENIASADVVLLMLSDNYKQSEVCLNEMGAAWALDKCMVQILLPNTTFDKLGWLHSLNKAIRIDESRSMDHLCEVIADVLGISIKLSVWNRNKEIFLSHCQCGQNQNSICAENNVDELGFWDYKEMLEADVQNVTNICLVISEAIKDSAQGFEFNAQKMNNLNPLNPNAQQVRGIMGAVTRIMDRSSEVYEENTPKLLKGFYSMVDTTVNLLQSSTKGSANDEELAFKTVQDLLINIRQARAAVEANKQVLDNMPKAEKSIIKARNRLSRNLKNLIEVLDECVLKGQDLIGAVIK